MAVKPTLLLRALPRSSYRCSYKASSCSVVPQSYKFLGNSINPFSCLQARTLASQTLLEDSTGYYEPDKNQELPQSKSASEETDENVHLPRSVQAVYFSPLRRRAKYGLPACDLQLRSYSVRNVEFFADFALRAAHYLNMPASGPIPLPKQIERWTVPRANFIFKKSQENFERITLRRLIQIQDAHPETVQIWLAFLKKHAFYGVGMKANVWEHEKLAVRETMEANLRDLQPILEEQWNLYGREKTVDTTESVVDAMQVDIARAAEYGTLLEPFKNDKTVRAVAAGQHQ